MLEEEKIKIINFLQDFGCATVEQLQTLCGKPNYSFKEILSSNIVSKKDNIFVHNTKTIDKKMIAALDILCKYKKRLIHFRKNYAPVYITFLTKNDTLYHIIVTDKENEKGVLKLLNMNPPYFQEADKYIVLFEDETSFDNIECSVPYLYCTYPNIKIVVDETRNNENCI